jgi:Cys-rich repeat protein
MIDAGASCGGSSVCNSGGSCVDCLGDVDCSVSSLPHCRTDTYSCVECTSNTHCTTGEEIRCNTSNNTCVECTSNAHCTTPGQTRCNTSNGQCVECTSDSHCGSAIDWDCTSNSCVRVARCGNGIIEPENNEQCDDPAQIGQGTCNSSCRIAGYYGACSLANGPNCPAPFQDSACGEVIPGEPRFCAPGCNGTDASCPNLVGWTEKCVFTHCMIGCSSGVCPSGYTCTHVDFGGGNMFDVCTLVQ